MKVALLAGLLASLTASAEARPFASAVEQFAPLVHQARHKTYQGRIRPKLGVVSFNVAGVPLTRHRGARLEAITERLRETGYSLARLPSWFDVDVVYDLGRLHHAIRLGLVHAPETEAVIGEIS